MEHSRMKQPDIAYREGRWLADVRVPPISNAKLTLIHSLAFVACKLKHVIQIQQTKHRDTNA